MAAAEVVVMAEEEAPTPALKGLVLYLKSRLTERLSRAGDILIKNSTNLTKTSVTKLWISINNVNVTPTRNLTLDQIL